MKYFHSIPDGMELFNTIPAGIEWTFHSCWNALSIPFLQGWNFHSIPAGMKYFHSIPKVESSLFSEGKKYVAVYSFVLYLLRRNNNHMFITRVHVLGSVHIYQIILSKYLQKHRDGGCKLMRGRWQVAGRGGGSYYCLDNVRGKI